MDTKSILAKLIKIASNQQQALRKLSQMGTGVRVKFHHPQYFAKLAKNLFKNAVGDDRVSVEVYQDRLAFYDGSGEMDHPELQKLVMQACASVEQSLNLDQGELFNYSNIEVA